MIYFLYGDNDYQIDRRVNELKRQFAGKYGADNIATIDINETLAQNLMGQLTAISLFAQHQMIIVKSITSSNDGWTMLENNIDYIPDDTVAVLTHTKSLSKVNNLAITKTFKKLKASGAKLEKFETMKSRDVRLWLVTEIKHRQLAVDGRAQAELLRLTAGEENQQARLAIELGKLALLRRPITVELIQEYVEPSLETNAFAILGAALSGEKMRAIKLLRQLSDSGEDVNRFLGLLASQELALASAITGAKVKLSAYQLGLARDLAGKLGSVGEQQAKLLQLTEVLAVLDNQIKLAKPDEAWLLVQAALAKL